MSAENVALVMSTRIGPDVDLSSLAGDASASTQVLAFAPIQGAQASAGRAIGRTLS